MKKIAAFIGIAAAFALIYYCIRYVQSPVSTLAAYSVTHEETVSCDAYIVRNETVYAAPSDGTFYSYAREGSRVGKNRSLCAVYSGSVSEEILKELATIDAKIAELSTTVVDETEFTTGGGSAESRLLAIQSSIEEAAAKNNIEEISRYKSEIEAIAAGEPVKSKSETLADLTSRKDALEAKITSPKQEIISTISGIYSTAVDGYEEILTPETARAMTAADFAKIKPEQRVQSTPEPKSGDEEEKAPDVYAGDKICKVVDNHEWYIMALVEKEDIKDLTTGAGVKIRFGKLPSEETTAVIEAVSNEAPEQEKAVLLLKCDSYSEGAFSIRTSGIEIIKSSVSGFQAPVSAMRVSNGQNGVMVRSAGKEVFKPCKVLFRDEKNGTVIISPDTSDTNKMLMQYDMIILGEK